MEVVAGAGRSFGGARKTGNSLAVIGHRSKMSLAQGIGAIRDWNHEGLEPSL